MKRQLLRVSNAFCITGVMTSFEKIKVGLVNQTYKVNFILENGVEKSYIIQSINTYAFKHPELIMDNIDQITEHMRSKRVGKVSLHFHHTVDGKTYYVDENGFWRLFNYIESNTYNVTADLDIVRNAGEAFGEFQMLLADYDASKLSETIPAFHDTRKRFEKLWKDAALDPCGRFVDVQEELDWLRAAEDRACRLIDLHKAGIIPLRVTHNDTKINNVLFDKSTRMPLVVIDLDTVMPGIVGNDFGDAIRFAANYVEEDCQNLELVGVNMDVYSAFAEGFLAKTANALMKEEIETLPLSCFAITVELATRFLADYILGDLYFHVNYPEHNLVRARNQIALAKDMLVKMDEMERVVKECVKNIREISYKRKENSYNF